MELESTRLEIIGIYLALTRPYDKLQMSKGFKELTREELQQVRIRYIPPGR